MIKKNSILRWKRNKLLKMFTRQKVLIVFLIILFASCSTTPSVKFDKYPISNKIDLKIALIINRQFKEFKHQSELVIPIPRRGNRGCEFPPIEVTVGPVQEDFFVKGFSHLFVKVDIYKDIAEVKNESDYDYILIPDIVISPFRGKFLSIYGGRFVKVEFAVEVQYELAVKAKRDNLGIITLTGKGKSANSADIGDCVNDILYYKLKGAYRDTTAEAMKSAFTELVKNTETRLLPIAKAKAEERLPSELALTVRFLDSGGFLPNTSLDAGEDAEIVVTIKNTGKGIGYGTNLEVISDNPKIALGGNITVGNIPPGETKNIRVNLKAAKDLEDGKASFQLYLKEKRGYDAKRVVLNVSTSNQINKVIDSIVAKITSQIRQRGWKRVVMAEIESHNGSYIDLEKYLLEEFYIRFRNMKEFSVVEKPLFNQALTALKTNFSDLVNPSSKTKILVNHDPVKKFGTLTGADTIFMVSIMDMKDLIKINTSLLDIDTGEIYITSVEEVAKDKK